MKTREMKKSRIMFFAGLLLIVPFFMVSCDDTPDPDEFDKFDITELTTLVSSAEAYLAEAEEGNLPGDYVLGAVMSLQTAVDAAKLVANDPPEAQADIETAITALEDAVFGFEAMEIEDVSLKFGATDSTIAVENSANAAVDFNMDVFTFETWVIYYDKPGFFGQILSTEFYEDGLRGWNVRIGDDDALDFTIADGNESRLQPTEGATVPRDIWTHIACTFDGEYMRSYINGVMVGELEASDRDSIFIASTLAGAQPLVLGNSAGFAQPERRLVGRLFDVRFWNVAKTEAEIAANKDFILTGEEENLVAYWPFAKNDPQTTISDATGNYNLELKNGTITDTRN